MGTFSLSLAVTMSPGIRTIVLALTCACASHAGVADTVTTGALDTLAVELAAARQILAEYKDLQVVIHPAFSDSFSSPGQPGRVRRDDLRTTALARALGGSIYAEPSRSRDRVKGTARLTLSEPVIESDTARITGTIMWYRDDQPRQGSGYRTDRFTLTREGTAWRVVGSDNLGIS
jgi:hypothetical protein